MLFQFIVMIVLCFCWPHANATEDPKKSPEDHAKNQDVTIQVWHSLQPQECEAFLRQLGFGDTINAFMVTQNMAHQSWGQSNSAQLAAYNAFFGTKLSQKNFGDPQSYNDLLRDFENFMKDKDTTLFNPVACFTRCHNNAFYHWNKAKPAFRQLCMGHTMGIHHMTIKEQPDALKDLMKYFKNPNATLDPVDLYEKHDFWIVLAAQGALLHEYRKLFQKDAQSFKWDFPVMAQLAHIVSIIYLADFWYSTNNIAPKHIQEFLSFIKQGQRVEFKDHWLFVVQDIIPLLNAYLGGRDHADDDLRHNVEASMGWFYYYHLQWVREFGRQGDLENGFTGAIARGSLTTGYYIQGGWSLDKEKAFPVMPRTVMGIIPENKKENVFLPCYYDRTFPLGSGLVMSDGQVANNPFLVIGVGGDSIELISLNGRNGNAPFSISQKTILSKADPQTTAAYHAVMSLPSSVGDANFFKVGQTYCLAMPETDADTDILDLLMNQMHKIEKKVKPVLKKTNVEELPDEEEAKHIAREARRAAQADVDKIAEEQRVAAEKQRMRDAEVEAIKKIENEIEEEEALAEQVRQEQDACRERVAAGSSPGSKASPNKRQKDNTSPHAHKPQPEEPQETPAVRKQRINALAMERFHAKKVTLRELASVINAISKIIPNARDLLLGYGRTPGLETGKNGSHFGLPGGRIHRPHAGDDGTLYASRALGFVNAFMELTQSVNKILKIGS